MDFVFFHIDKWPNIRYNAFSIKEALSWDVRHDYRFYPHLHKRIPGRFMDVKPPLSGEGSKWLQVSALPERRVKKRCRTAFWDNFLRSRAVFPYGSVLSWSETLVAELRRFGQMAGIDESLSN